MGEGRPDIEAQYDKYNIDREHDDPNNSSDKYPPDWNLRQGAMLDYHNETCARCRRPIGSADESLDFHVHHIIPLQKRGGHELKNLAPLCVPCHSLMHPNNDNLGDWKKSPMFPARTADRRVAVERLPLSDLERAVYDDRSDESQIGVNGDVNVYARSSKSTDVPAEIAVTKENPKRKDKKELSVGGGFEFFCDDCGSFVETASKRCSSCTMMGPSVVDWKMVGAAAIVLLLLLAYVFAF